MNAITELNSRYSESLKNPRTLRVNHLLLCNLQAFDFCGTLTMISKYGIGSEANEVAKQLLSSHNEIVALYKILILPLIVVMVSGFVYTQYADRQKTKGDCEKWAERVIILMQSLNTLYLAAFVVISAANVVRS